MAKHLFEQVRRRHRKKDLRATFLASIEALTASLRSYSEFMEKYSSFASGKTSGYLRDAERYAEDLIGLFSEEDFLALVADDTWARTEVLKYRSRVEALLEEIKAGDELSQNSIDLVQPRWIDVFVDTGRWRRPPAGARFTDKLTGRTQMVRWWHLRRWLAIRRYRAQRRQHDGNGENGS